VTHAIAFLAKTLAAQCAQKGLRVLVDAEVVLEVSHLLEHFLALVDAAHEELTSSNSSVVCRLNVEVLRVRIN